jgi:hypothetical protein
VLCLKAFTSNGTSVGVRVIAGDGLTAAVMSFSDLSSSLSDFPQAETNPHARTAIAKSKMVFRILSNWVSLRLPVIAVFPDTQNNPRQVPLLFFYL